jgi:hypothetical protein
LIETVEASQFVEALRTSYADDAVAQENLGATTQGVAAIVAREAVLAVHQSVRTRGYTYLIEGDTVVIRWVFDFVDHSGRRSSLDELAHQLWQGSEIIQERFYYGPGQAASAPSPVSASTPRRPVAEKSVAGLARTAVPASNARG